jgi:glycosyltransferase involved in cell wall biosynthesis
LFKKIWSNASAIAACSEGLRQRALNFFPDVKITSIPNGVDLERFKPNERNEPSKSLKLITVGRLSPTKRVELLIDAVKLLNGRGLDARMKIVGGGSLKQKLRAIVSKQGLDSSIEFAGRVDAGQMPRLYQESDIYVSATMQEGMSNAMLEAMASGLPIVTTECEGLEELINDNGIVVGDADAQIIALSIERITKDIDLYKNMSVVSRNKAEHFSWNAAAEKYIALYKSVITERTGG